jgi:hypothetical protein
MDLSRHIIAWSTSALLRARFTTYWLVKSDETVPLRFAAVIGTLLAYRLLVTFGGRIFPARVARRVGTLSQSVR